jgi:hypothetical protein
MPPPFEKPIAMNPSGRLATASKARDMRVGYPIDSANEDASG